MNADLFEIIDLPGTPDCQLCYCEQFLKPETAERVFTSLYNHVDWQEETVTVYGKSHPAPRLTAWYGDPGAGYRYSGVVHTPTPWSDELLYLKQRIEQCTDSVYNSVLLNLYRNGNDSVGWHSDDEPELGAAPTIASLSLGETRRFLIKPTKKQQYKKQTQRNSLELHLPAGSLLLMRGRIQRLWCHSVPKEKGIDKPRINLTFRLVQINT